MTNASGRAPVNIHVDKDVPIVPVIGHYGWLDVGGVCVHCHAPEDADRLAEAARELAAGLRLGTRKRAS